MNEKQEVENIIKAKMKEAVELIEAAGIRFPESITFDTVNAQKIDAQRPQRIISRFEIVQ